MRHSESLAALAPALVAFQKEITNPVNTASNPHFRSKYAPLPDILNHVRPILAKHALAVIQGVQTDGTGRAGVVTMVVHKSGEFIETEPVLLKDRSDNAQGAGSAITYARRYSLAAALGIGSEDDDDANAASSPPPRRRRAAAPADEGFRDEDFGLKPGLKPAFPTSDEEELFQQCVDRLKAVTSEAELDNVGHDAKALPEELKKKLRYHYGQARNRLKAGREPGEDG